MMQIPISLNGLQQRQRAPVLFTWTEENLKWGMWMWNGSRNTNSISNITFWCSCQFRKSIICISTQTGVRKVRLKQLIFYENLKVQHYKNKITNHHIDFGRPINTMLQDSYQVRNLCIYFTGHNRREQEGICETISKFHFRASWKKEYLKVKYILNDNIAANNYLVCKDVVVSWAESELTLSLCVL